MNNFDKLLGLAKEKVTDISDAPFIISIMGQTGVGKSSLLNALFNTNLKTDPVKPCTKDPEKISAINEKGFKLWFYDLPGIGESSNADEKYFKEYISLINQSDIVLWAIHADNRSTTFDVQTLRRIVESLRENEKQRFLNSLTIVLTKTDTLYNPPWIFVKDRVNSGFFTISKELRLIFEQKSDYYQDNFISPYANFIQSSTFNDSEFNLNIKDFYYNEKEIQFKRILTKERMNQLIREYPEHKNVFIRLNTNNQPIYCSSILKFNLSQLLMVIANKLSGEASIRMQNFLKENDLNRISITLAKNISNLIVFDSNKKTTLFDLTTLKI